MAKQISSLAVKLAMETDGLVKGAKLSRAAMQEVKAAYASTTSPAQELDARIKVLGEAFDKGAIPLARYQAQLAKLREEMARATAGTTPFKNVPAKQAGVAAGTFAGNAALNLASSLPGGSEIAAIAAGAQMAGPAGAAIAAGAVVISGGMRLAASGVHAFTAEMEKQFNVIDQWNMQADELGTKVESFATFRGMSDDLRMGTEEIAGAMQKMQQRIGAAAFGGLDSDGGKIGKTLRGIGVDAEALAAQQPEQQLRTIAEAISKVKSPAEQAAAAFDIFGKQGQKLLPALKGGAAAIDEYAAKSGTLREALTKSENVKALDGAFDDLKQTFEGLAAVATVELAPGITAAVNAINEIASSQDAVNVIVGAFTTLSEAASISVSVIREVPAAIEAASGQTGVLATAIQMARGVGNELRTARAEAAELDKKLAESRKKLGIGGDDSAKGKAAAADAQVHRLTEALREQDEAGKVQTKSIEAAARQADKLAASGADVSVLLRQIAEAKLGQVADDVAKATKAAEDHTGKLRDQVETWGQVGEAAHIAGMKREAAALAANGATDEQLAGMRKQIELSQQLADQQDELKGRDDDKQKQIQRTNKAIDAAGKLREEQSTRGLAKSLFGDEEDDSVKLARQVEEARRTRDEIQDLLNRQLITPAEANAGVAKLQKELDREFGKRHLLNVALPDAVNEGTAEFGRKLDEANERRFIRENQVAAPALAPIVDLNKFAQEQAAKDEENANFERSYEQTKVLIKLTEEIKALLGGIKNDTDEPIEVEEVTIS